jgi:hypothetical protein
MPAGVVYVIARMRQGNHTYDPKNNFVRLNHAFTKQALLYLWMTLTVLSNKIYNRGKLLLKRYKEQVVKYQNVFPLIITFTIQVTGFLLS